MSFDDKEEPVMFPYQRIKQNPSTRDLCEPSGAITDWKSPEPIPYDPKTGLSHRCISYYTEHGTPVYYQDTKEGKEWAKWAYSEYLKQEAKAKGNCRKEEKLF